MKTLRIIALGMALITAGSMSMAAKRDAGKAKAPAAGVQQNRNIEWWGPGPGRLNQKPTVGGKVTAVDPARIEIQTKKQGTMAFVINAQTKFRVAGKAATVADVKVGDKVGVRFEPVDGGVAIALGVVVPAAKAQNSNRIRGEIKAINGNILTIGDKQVTVTPQTKFRSGRYVGSLADLRVGYHAVVAGDPAAAKMIEFMPNLAKGTVTEVTADTITVKTIRQGTLQLKPGAGTIFMVRPRVADNHLGTIADVKVGTPVNVGFDKESGALLWIDILTGI